MSGRTLLLKDMGCKLNVSSQTHTHTHTWIFFFSFDPAHYTHTHTHTHTHTDVYHCVFGDLKESLYSCCNTALDEASRSGHKRVVFWVDGFAAIAGES